MQVEGPKETNDSFARALMNLRNTQVVGSDNGGDTILEWTGRIFICKDVLVGARKDCILGRPKSRS